MKKTKKLSLQFSSLFILVKRVLPACELRHGDGDEPGSGGQGVGGAEGVGVGEVVGLVLHAVDRMWACLLLNIFEKGFTKIVLFIHATFFF